MEFFYIVNGIERIKKKNKRVNWRVFKICIDIILNFEYLLVFLIWKWRER